jgi:hypothetical protein
MTFMQRVTPVVDETIRALAKKKFMQDPVAGLKYSRATSIISSAYKRHGRIIETALRESLRESNRHRVWQEDAFRVSRAADTLVGSQSEDACRQTTLPYGDSVRTGPYKLIWLPSTVPIKQYGLTRSNAALANSTLARFDQSNAT